MDVPQSPLRMTCLGDFAEDCRALSEEAFKARHGDLFFLHNGPLGKLNPAEEGQKTLAIEGRATSPGVPMNPSQDFVVFRVPPAPEGTRDLIWIGRSEENELVIPDASVSAIHAFLRVDPSGRVLMHDSGSRNGSQVDDEPVPSPGMGPPAEIASGARVVLGEVKLTFLHAAEFQELVKRLLSR
ncbi:MAG TPA: FHA domain-containing protein [Myxococcota bacterium]|nr:FHA domain-containing protein [Myxococcota bacterium]HRY96924.1 FHA domain-containing protein [Myxococcota bacterium]HSA22489.1 FHA domain-containing protein [Myxococcota bacterium]